MNEEEIRKEVKEHLNPFGLEEYEDIVVEGCKKAEEAFNKVFKPRRCQICGAPATKIIAASPIRASEAKDEVSLRKAIYRQLCPTIYLCRGHSDEEINKRFGTSLRE